MEDLELPLHRRGLLVGLAAWACGPARAAAVTPIGHAVTWPEISRLDAAPLAPSALAGHPVVLVFFSTDCPYCRRHNQRLDRLARSGVDVRVLGVAQDRDPEPVRAYRRQLGASFDMSMDAATLRPMFTARRIIPMTCVVDRHGTLREVIPGEMAEDDIMGLARWGQAS